VVERTTAQEGRDLVGIGLVVFGVVNSAVGAYLLISPHSFFLNVAPFGVENDHYMRDAGTFQLALGLAQLVAHRWRAWRLGVLGYSFLQYLFHTINHLADINESHPQHFGRENFAALAIGTVLLGGLLRIALRDRAERGP
jgi:uncharacterized membrane protein (UPF0182 family)